MDFFEKLVIPPSQNHILLIKYLLMVCFLIFIPYIGMILGSTFLSVYFDGKGKGESNPVFSRFARDITTKLTFSKYAGIAMGVVPLLSILFGYSQLLYGSNSIAMSIMTAAILLIYAGLICIYRYRETFVIEGVIKNFRDISKIDTSNAGKKEAEEIENYEEKLMNTNSRLGKLGLTFLFFGLYLFAGSTALAANPARWGSIGNVLQVLFWLDTGFNLLYLIIVAGVVTGGAALFFFFYWEGGLEDMDTKYETLVKSVSSKMILFSVICLPLFLFIKFLFLPAAAQAPALFTYLLFTFILVLILANLIYSMVRHSNYGYATLVFALTFVVLAFGILNDQIAFGSAISEHLKMVVEKSEELEKEVKSKTMTSSGIDAEAIYNTKCVACHKFDVKVVGPPYQQTVPKYNGDVNALAEFIYNPVKKSPDYPPMPNQGLKKKEALAMAKWLMDKVGGKK